MSASPDAVLFPIHGLNIHSHQAGRRPGHTPERDVTGPVAPSTGALTWSVLWQWLKPDALLLAGAVAAAVAVAIANVNIPIALGLVSPHCCTPSPMSLLYSYFSLPKMVNCVTSGAGMASMRPIAIRVMCLYLFQVCVPIPGVFPTRAGQSDLHVHRRPLCRWGAPGRAPSQPFLRIWFVTCVGPPPASYPAHPPCPCRPRPSSPEFTITRAVLHQDVAFFDSHRSGEIVDRLAADVQEFKVSTLWCTPISLCTAVTHKGLLHHMHA